MQQNRGANEGFAGTDISRSSVAVSNTGSAITGGDADNKIKADEGGDDTTGMNGGEIRDIIEGAAEDDVIR